MRIICPHCGQTGRILQVKNECVGLKTIYLQCQNPDCAAKTVHKVSYSHDVVAPKTNIPNLCAELFEKLDPEQQQALIRRYQRPPTGVPPGTFK